MTCTCTCACRVLASQGLADKLLAHKVQAFGRVDRILNPSLEKYIHHLRAAFRESAAFSQAPNPETLNPQTLKLGKGVEGLWLLKSTGAGKLAVPMMCTKTAHCTNKSLCMHCAVLTPLTQSTLIHSLKERMNEGRKEGMHGWMKERMKEGMNE